MKSAEKIERLAQKIRFSPDASTNERILDCAEAALKDRANRAKPKRFELNMWRIIMKRPITKLAAVAVIIIAVIVGISHFGGSIDLATPVFANVLNQIYKARTVTYTRTAQYSGNDRKYTKEYMVMEPGHVRIISGSSVIVRDFSQGISLDIYPEQRKTVITRQIGGKKRIRPFNYLECVTKLNDKTGKFMGQQEIDGQMVNVFLFQEEFEKTTVWVNPETDLPVKVERIDIPNPDKSIIKPEMSLRSDDFEKVEKGGTIVSSSIDMSGSGGIIEKSTTTLTNFVWDAELDESLFSTDPPAGYITEEKQLDVSQTTEKDLVEIFALWAAMSDGRFPSAITDLGDPNKVKPILVKKFAKGGDAVEELEQAMAVLHRILKVLMFAQQRKIFGSWGYNGDRVRLGDIDKPLCWWKSEDSESYRVVYGDLSIGDANVIDSHEEP